MNSCRRHKSSITETLLRTTGSGMSDELRYIYSICWNVSLDFDFPV